MALAVTALTSQDPAALSAARAVGLPNPRHERRSLAVVGVAAHLSPCGELRRVRYVNYLRVEG